LRSEPRSTLSLHRPPPARRRKCSPMRSGHLRVCGRQHRTPRAMRSGKAGRPAMPAARARASTSMVIMNSEPVLLVGIWPERSSPNVVPSVGQCVSLPGPSEAVDRVGAVMRWQDKRGLTSWLNALGPLARNLIGGRGGCARKISLASCAMPARRRQAGTSSQQATISKFAMLASSMGSIFK
jgi:hypothetical protein